MRILTWLALLLTLGLPGCRPLHEATDMIREAGAARDTIRGF